MIPVRLLVQLFMAGGQIVGRAFAAAYAQAAREGAKGAHSSFSAFGARSAARMSESEASKILGLGSNPTRAEVQEAYGKLFKLNDPEKGGSFYLQSKVHMAYEFLEGKAGPKGTTPNASAAQGNASASTSAGSGSSSSSSS